MYREYLSVAKSLAGAARSRPKQAELRRAVSTAYYALFHALCETSANAFIGTKSPNRADRAWEQTYRALQHKAASEACKRCSSGTGKGGNAYRFPAKIEYFARTFFVAQVERHRADYAPAKTLYSRADVFALINAAEAAIQSLQSAPRKHKAAFAALCLFPERDA